MKSAIIGTALILYGLFLTPCVIEPSDMVISPAWIAVAMSLGIPIFIVAMWILSGYLALFVGIGLLGHSMFHHLPVITAGVRNPIALVLLIAFIILVICLWFYYVT